MRILFFLNGSMWRYTLPAAFNEIGYETAITDTLDEVKIKTQIEQFSPHFVMSMGWGREQNLFNQLTIRRCAKASKVPHIYWSVEDPAYTHSFSLLLIQRVQPDFVFSISPSSVELYKKMNIQSAYMDFGFAPAIHKPTEYDAAYSSSIAIVAGAYPTILKKYPNHYRHTSIQTLIVPLLKQNIRIDFWGKDWDKMNHYLNFHLPPEWIHGPIDYPDTNKVYCSSKIILGLQNYTSQLTQRTYEILASGGFLLTSDTPAVRKLFEPAKQLIVSSTPEETLNLVTHYLIHPEERAQITHSAPISLSGFSYTNRARYIIETLKSQKII